jgi:hypothetical protein
MMKVSKKPASEFVGGEVVRTVDDTVCGLRPALHKATCVRCNLKDRLIEIELRDGPVLRYLLPLSPEATLEVAS